MNPTAAHKLEQAILHPEEETQDQVIGRMLKHYECESLLGGGTMGKVYRAFHHQLQRPCALKILTPHHSSSRQELFRRFLTEGRSSAALVHANIVTMHAIDQYQSRFLLEMEYVPGGSIGQLIREQGRLPPIHAMRLGTEVAAGLAHAHRHGILHRDVKAENVMLTAQGHAKLCDFGLADHEAELSQARSAGTPLYMAPELFQGAAASPETDVYSLGVLLFYLLTENFPFVAESSAALGTRVTHEAVPSVREFVPEIPLEIADCVDMMLRKAPSDRPRSAIDAHQLLAAILGELRDLQSLIDEALSPLPNVESVKCGELYRVSVALPEGRQQRVYIESSQHRFDQRLVLIYSNCCEVNSQFYETALRLNAGLSHGAIAIRNIDGLPHYVMLDSYPRSTVDAEEIRKSLLEVATQADSIEKLLTGRDVH